MKIAVLRGDALARTLPDVARLRIEVFRDWPYLYDGDLRYEERYLQSYRESPEAIVVGAYDGESLVGASTGTPLADHADDFARAFEGSGVALEDVFYGAESVLLPAYRGQGIGHAFSDLREAHARQLGFTRFCFCAVQRPDDHPARPDTYRPLDAFWRGRGFAPLPGVVATFDWKDTGEAEQTAKPLQFWIKDL